MVEQGTHKPLVGSSNLPLATHFRTRVLSSDVKIGTFSSLAVTRQGHPVFVQNERVTVMGVRFHKSKRLLPGVRANASKGGLGLSFGLRGVRHSIGPAGRRTTVSIPGTGISYVQQHKLSLGGTTKRISCLSTAAAIVLWRRAWLILLLGLVVLWLLSR